MRNDDGEREEMERKRGCIWKKEVFREDGDREMRGSKFKVGM